jgi:hypothetical protein
MNDPTPTSAGLLSSAAACRIGTGLVQVEVTSSTFGSTTSNRQFTSAKFQGSWKIDNIAL